MRRHGSRIRAEAWPVAFEDGKLLPQSEDFQRGIQTTNEEDPKGRENYGDKIDTNHPCNTL
jgi:hypothetical protein